MKKKRITWLLLLSACMLSACGKGERDTPPAEPEPVIQEEQKAVPETQPEKIEKQEPPATATGKYLNDTWADSDFQLFGLEGVEKFLQQEPTTYICEITETRTGMNVKFTGTDDFDAVTQYTKTLFDMTTSAGGGISYGKVYDNDVMNYVVSQTYETFADLCNDQGWNTDDGTNTVDGFYVKWFCQYEGTEMEVVVTGGYSEKNNYMSFALCLR